MSFPTVDYAKYQTSITKDGQLQLTTTHDDQSASSLNPILYPPTTDFGCLSTSSRTHDAQAQIPLLDEEQSSCNRRRRPFFSGGDLSWSVPDNKRKKKIVVDVTNVTTNEANDMLSILLLFPKTFQVGVSASAGSDSNNNDVAMKLTFPYPSNKKKNKKQQQQSKSIKEKDATSRSKNSKALSETTQDHSNTKQNTKKRSAKAPQESIGDNNNNNEKNNRAPPQDARPMPPLLKSDDRVVDTNDTGSSSVTTSKDASSSTKAAAAEVASVSSQSKRHPPNDKQETTQQQQQKEPTFVTNCLKFLLPPPYGENKELLSLIQQGASSEDEGNNDSSSSIRTRRLKLEVSIQEHSNVHLADKYMIYRSFGHTTMVRVATEMAHDYSVWRQRNLHLNALLKSHDSMEVELEASLQKFELLNVLEEVPTSFPYRHYQHECIERWKNPNRKTGIIMEDENDSDNNDDDKQDKKDKDPTKTKETKQFFLPGRCFAGLFDHLGETELCMLIAMDGREILSKAEACHQWELAQKKSALASSKARRSTSSNNKGRNKSATATLTLLIPPHVVPRHTNKSSFLKILKVNDKEFDSFRSSSSNNADTTARSSSKSDGAVKTNASTSSSKKSVLQQGANSNASKLLKQEKKKKKQLLANHSANVKNGSKNSSSNSDDENYGSKTLKKNKNQKTGTKVEERMDNNEERIKKKKKKISKLLDDDEEDNDDNKKDDDEDHRDEVKGEGQQIPKKKKKRLNTSSDDSNPTNSIDLSSIPIKKKKKKVLQDETDLVDSNSEEEKEDSEDKRQKRHTNEKKRLRSIPKKKGVSGASTEHDTAAASSSSADVATGRLPKKKRKVDYFDTKLSSNQNVETATTVLSTSDNVKESYVTFAKKTEEIRKLDYIGIHGKIMEGSMWSQHKKLIGEHCDEQCTCLSKLRDLCSHIVESFEDKKGKQERYTITGFAKYFVPRFYSLVSKEFPLDQPSQILEKLCLMWSKHFTVVKSRVCNALCPCDSKWDSYFLPKVLLKKPQPLSDPAITSTSTVAKAGDTSIKKKHRSSSSHATATTGEETDRQQKQGRLASATSNSSSSFRSGGGNVNVATTKTEESLFFSIDYDPANEPLPFYAVTWVNTRKIGQSRCKVLSVNTYIPSPPRDLRIRNGSMVIASEVLLRSSIGGSKANTDSVIMPKRSIHKFEFLRKGFEFAKKHHYILRLFFDNTFAKQDYKNHHWNPNGSWAGKICDDGWAGGNPVLYNMQHSHNRRPPPSFGPAGSNVTPPPPPPPPPQQQHYHHQHQHHPPQAYRQQQPNNAPFYPSQQQQQQASQSNSNFVHQTPSLNWTTSTSASNAGASNKNIAAPSPRSASPPNELEELNRQYGKAHVLQPTPIELPKSKDQRVPTKSILRPSKYNNNNDKSSKEETTNKKKKKTGRKLKFAPKIKDIKYFQRDPPPSPEDLPWSDDEEEFAAAEESSYADESEGDNNIMDTKPSSSTLSSSSPLSTGSASSFYNVLMNGPISLLLKDLESGVFDASSPDAKGRYARDYLEQEIKRLKTQVGATSSSSQSITTRLKDMKLRRNLISLYLRSESILRSSMSIGEWKCFQLNFQSISNLHISGRAALTDSDDNTPNTIFCEASMPSRPKFATTPLPITDNNNGTMKWDDGSSLFTLSSFVFVCDDLELQKENFLQIGIFKGSPQSSDSSAAAGQQQKHNIMLGKVNAELSELSNDDTFLKVQHTRHIPISDFLSQEGKLTYEVIRQSSMNEQVMKQRTDHLRKDLGHSIQEVKSFMEDIKIAELNELEDLVKSMTFPKCYGMNLLHAAVYLEDLNAIQALLGIQFDPKKSSQKGSALELSEQISQTSSKQKQIQTLLKAWI